MPEERETMVLRFRLGQRVIHWLTVFSGLMLFISLFLVLPALSGAAAAGISSTIHRVFAAVLLLVPVLYLIIDPGGLVNLVRHSVRFDRDDLRWLLGNLSYFFGRSRHLPPQGRYNAAQKIHHLGVICCFLALAASGLVMWLGKGVLGAAPFLFMVTVHNLAVWALAVLTIGHVYFVLLYGALGGMLGGFVSARYVRFEHRKWWEELQRENRED